MLRPRVGHPAILSPSTWRRIGLGFRPFVHAWTLLRANYIAMLLMLMALRELGAAFAIDLWFERPILSGAATDIQLHLYAYAQELVQLQVHATLVVVLTGTLIAPLGPRSFRWNAGAVMLVCGILYVFALAGLPLQYLWAVTVLTFSYEPWVSDLTFRLVVPVTWAAAFALVGPFVPFVVSGRPWRDVVGQARRAIACWPRTFGRLLVYAVPVHAIGHEVLHRLDTLVLLFIPAAYVSSGSSISLGGLSRGLTAVGGQLLYLYVLAVVCVIVCEAWQRSWRSEDVLDTGRQL